MTFSLFPSYLRRLNAVYTPASALEFRKKSGIHQLSHLVSVFLVSLIIRRSGFFYTSF
jgi:hypothetical protein